MLVTRPSPWYIFQPNIKIPSERWDNRGESWKLIIFLDFEPWVEANLRILLHVYKGENQQFSRKLTFVFRSELTSISKWLFDFFFRIHSYLSATTYSIFSTVGALSAKQHHKNLQYPPSAGFSKFNYHPHNYTDSLPRTKIFEKNGDIYDCLQQSTWNPGICYTFGWMRRSKSLSHESLYCCTCSKIAHA